MLAPDHNVGRACRRALHEHPPQPAGPRPVGPSPLRALAGRGPQPRVLPPARTAPWSVPTSPTTPSDRSTVSLAVLQPRGLVRPRRPSAPGHTPADPAARSARLPLHRLLAERQRRRAQPAAEVHRPRHHDSLVANVPLPRRRGDMRVTAGRCPARHALWRGARALPRPPACRRGEAPAAEHAARALLRRVPPRLPQEVRAFASLLHVSNPELFRAAVGQVSAIS